jgi:hypothetical protein
MRFVYFILCFMPVLASGQSYTSREILHLPSGVHFDAELRVNIDVTKITLEDWTGRVDYCILQTIPSGTDTEYYTVRDGASYRLTTGTARESLVLMIEYPDVQVLVFLTPEECSKN